MDIREMKEKAMRNVLTISEDDYARVCAQVLDDVTKDMDDATVFLLGAALMAKVQHRLFD